MARIKKKKNRRNNKHSAYNYFYNFIKQFIVKTINYFTIIAYVRVYASPNRFYIVVTYLQKRKKKKIVFYILTYNILSCVIHMYTYALVSTRLGF